MKETILIVEDDASIAQICSIALDSAGFKVITAPNGQEGLKMALSLTPDLILLDILMPVMDGFTMLQQLRQTNDYGKEVPVIMLTNLSAGNEDTIKKIAETEPVYYIVKSSTRMAEVVDKVREYLASSKRQ